MTVSLLYFGILKDMTGKAGGRLEMPVGATVADVLAAVRTPGALIWGTVAVAVNREYAGLGTVLQEGDEVAFLPPVSGGAGDGRLARRGWGTWLRGGR